MEYVIRVGERPVDLAILAHHLLDLDPAMLVDRDVVTGHLRCSTSALAVELMLVFAQAGHRLAPDAIERLPSVCCGGCSG